MKNTRYSAAGGVVIHAGRMLLLDRPIRGEVRLPKGHIDPGETADEAALRETQEESGYADLEIVHDLGRHTVEFEYQGVRVVRDEHYFLMRLRSEVQLERSAKDSAQFRVLWAATRDAPGLLTYAAEQEVAARACTAADNLGRSLWDDEDK